MTPPTSVATDTGQFHGPLTREVERLRAVGCSWHGTIYSKHCAECDSIGAMLRGEWRP